MRTSAQLLDMMENYDTADNHQSQLGGAQSMTGRKADEKLYIRLSSGTSQIAF
jgi:hypothetical protein